MAIIDQLENSLYSLQGNGLNPRPSQPGWGFLGAANTLDPKLSEMQNTYSVDGDPNVRVIDFNRQANQGLTLLPTPSQIDELDSNAPNNTAAGNGTGVVTQIYKSKAGRKYADLGPSTGQY